MLVKALIKQHSKILVVGTKCIFPSFPGIPIPSWGKKTLKPPRKGRKPDSIFILEQKVTRVLSGLKIGFCP